MTEEPNLPFQLVLANVNGHVWLALNCADSGRELFLLCLHALFFLIGEWQWRLSVRSRAECLSHACVLLRALRSRGITDISHSFLVCAVGPSHASVSYVVVCVCPSQTPHLSLTPRLSRLVAVMFSVSVRLFLLCE